MSVALVCKEKLGKDVNAKRCLRRSADPHAQLERHLANGVTRPYEAGR